MTIHDERIHDHDHSHIHTHDHDHSHDHNHDEGMDWNRLQAWIQTGIMFLTGLYFVDLALPGGNLGNYINTANFGWLTWVGAFILLSIAVMNTIDLMRPHKHDDHDHDHSHDHSHDDHDHSHAKAGSLSAWVFLGMLAIPLALGLGVGSEPLGAGAISGELSSDIRSIGFSTPSEVVIAPEERNILDWVRAFSTAQELNEFEGEPVNIIGFVYRDARFANTDNFMLVRFTLSCCVADARPLGLVVDNPEAAEYAQDTWLEVTGHFEIRSIDGVDTPVIIADSITEIQQPDQPYLYF